MNVGYEIFYLTQWVIFLVRLILSWGYGVVQFFGKPGSRIIVPAGIVIAGYLNLGRLQNLTADLLYNYQNRDLPGIVAAAQRQFQEVYYGHAIDPWVLDAVLVFVFVLTTCAYVIASRALSLVLGAFPKVTRPLRPMRRLRATNQKITSAVVTIAVPKLPR